MKHLAIAALFLIIVLPLLIPAVMSQGSAPASDIAETDTPPPTPTPSASPTPVVVAAQGALVRLSGPTATPTADPNAVHSRPETGVIENHTGGTGKGELTVRNGTDGDGLVILVLPDDQPVLAAYIRAGEDCFIEGIPDGLYRIYFSKGDAWDETTQQFTQNVTYERFEDTVDFRSSGSEYTTWEVTLYGVVGGNAPTEGVNPQEFPSLQ